MSSITAKVVEFKKAKLIKLVREAEIEILKNIAKSTKKAIQTEVPVDTGNLRDSTVIGSIVEVGNMMAVKVGSDEGRAYYAPHVYFPGITRNYGGNPYIDRALDRVITRRDQLIKSGMRIVYNKLTSL